MDVPFPYNTLLAAKATFRITHFWTSPSKSLHLTRDAGERFTGRFTRTILPARTQLTGASFLPGPFSVPDEHLFKSLKESLSFLSFPDNTTQLCLKQKNFLYKKHDTLYYAPIKAHLQAVFAVFVKRLNSRVS
jgi:hypothetical protein